MRRAPAIVATLATLATLVALAPAAAQAQAHPDAAAFWRTLDDPLLERLVVSALDANRDIASARSRIASARAMRTHAAFELAPVVGLAGGYSRQRLSSGGLPGTGVLPGQDVWDAGVQVSWELDVFGRGRRTVQARGSLLDAAHADARAVEIAVAAEVAQAYLHIRGARDRLEVASLNAANQERTLGLTRSRLEGGRGTELDTERAQAQLSSTRAEIPSLEAFISAQAHRIAVLLALPPAAGNDLDIAVGPLLLPADLRIPSHEQLVRARPDVQGAASMAAAEAALAGAARAELLPRLSFGAVAGVTAHSFDALGGRGTPRHAFGPVVSWPLLDLGRLRASAAAAQALHDAATARHQQLTLAALAEVETALVSYRRARERLTHLESAARASDRATALARLRFEEGAADFLEVLDAERRQLEAHDRLASGRIEAADWLVTVYRVTGGGVVP